MTHLKSRRKPLILLFNAPSMSSKNVVRDLLYGCWCRGKRIAGATFPPHSFLSLYTSLKDEFKVKLLDYQMYKFDLNVFGRILRFFDWIVLNSSYQTLHDDLQLLKFIKERKPMLNTVIFGAVSTFSPEIVNIKYIDYGIIGEPEIAIKNLIKVVENLESQQPLDQNAVPFGIASKINLRLITKPPKYFSLDKIPIPDRTPIKDFYYFNPLTKSKRWTTVLSSRGCPNNCIFCTSPAFYGKHYRYNSVDYSIKEIKYLMSLGFDEFFFRDETFTIDRKRVLKFSESIIEEKLNIGWICNARANNLDLFLLVKMKQAGCHTIKIGVESGSQRILNTLNKGITIMQIKNAFKWIKQVGIRSHAHMILGSPGETPSDIMQTFSLLKEINPDTVTFNIFTPFPGSPIFHRLLNSKGGTRQDYSKKYYQEQSSEFFPEILNKNSHIDPKKWIIYAYRKFYFRPKFILNLIKNQKKPSQFWQLLKSGFNIFSYVFGNSND